MRERPDAEDLIAIARQTLVDAVLPALPPERRFEALMIASALGIAGRELAAGLAPQPDQSALVTDIRAGKLDDAAPVHAALLAAVSERLAISDPKWRR